MRTGRVVRTSRSQGSPNLETREETSKVCERTMSDHVCLGVGCFLELLAVVEGPASAPPVDEADGPAAGGGPAEEEGTLAWEGGGWLRRAVSRCLARDMVMISSCSHPVTVVRSEGSVREKRARPVG